MKPSAIFTHDTYFLGANQGELLAGGGINYEALTFYLRHFSSVAVCCRIKRVKLACTADHSPGTGPGIRAVEVPNLSGPLMAWRNRRTARQVLEAELNNADVLIARIPSEISLLAIAVAQKMGKPYLIELVGCAFDALWNYGSLWGRLYAPVAMLRTRQVVLNAPRVVYVTSRFLQKRYPHRSFAGLGGNLLGGAVMHSSKLKDAALGCDPASATADVLECSNVLVESPPSSLLAGRLSRTAAAAHVLRLGMIGSLTTASKGTRTVLKALSLLMRHTREWEFRHLGVGDNKSYVDYARALGIAEHVHFDGVLTHDKVLAWLDEIDLYLQPSRQEGLPRALIEAMSRGCPAIGSTAGGIPELLEPGCLHAPGDANRLARLIEKAMADSRWMAEQARRNFEISRKYEQKILLAKRDAFFQRFVDDAVNDI